MVEGINNLQTLRSLERGHSVVSFRITRHAILLDIFSKTTFMPNFIESDSELGMFPRAFPRMHVRLGLIEKKVIGRESFDTTDDSVIKTENT